MLKALPLFVNLDARGQGVVSVDGKRLERSFTLTISCDSLGRMGVRVELETEPFAFILPDEDEVPPWVEAGGSDAGCGAH
jgi:hypothetical protein